jgi:Na+/melibiose symporter-like transporter
LSPTWSIIPGVYAKYYGVSLSAVAAIILVTRILDAVIDPVIGVLSDRHRARGGLRRSWVMTGGLGLIVAGYFLFSPPIAVSPLYLFFALAAFFICWTTVEVPQFAWGREIGGTLQERSAAFGWKTVFSFAGHAAFFSIPFLPFLPTHEYSPALMGVAIMVGAAFMVVALCANYLLAPNGATTKHDPPNIRAAINLVRTNGPLRLFVLIAVLEGISGGMWYGVMYIYLSATIPSSKDIALIFLSSSVICLCTIPLWTRLIQSIGPVRGLLVCKCIYVMAFLGSLVLSPPSSWLVPQILITTSFIAMAGSNVIFPLLLADVADYSLLKSKMDFGGTLFASHAFIGKVCYALGVSAALAILGIFGFDATSKEQSDLAKTGLALAYAGIPLVLAIVIAALSLRIPLTRQRAALVRKRLLRTDGLA